MDENNLLLKALKKNNNSLVITNMYKKLFPKFAAFVKRNNGTTIEAEDCFQDALTVLIQKVRNEPDVEISVYDYLFQVAKFRWYRRVKRVISRETDLENADYQLSDGMDIILDNEKSRIIDVLLSSLGSTCKDLLVYFLYEKRRINEITSIMNFSNDNVTKSSKYRCMNKLKKIIIENPELAIDLRF